MLVILVNKFVSLVIKSMHTFEHFPFVSLKYSLASRKQWNEFLVMLDTSVFVCVSSIVQIIVSRLIWMKMGSQSERE